MRRMLGIVLMVLMCATVVFASGDQEPEKPTLQFWHSLGGRNGELLDTMVEKFLESQDDFDLVATYQGGYWDAAAKAQAAVSAGQNPDLLMMGADHVSIFASEEGVLADLLGYVKASDSIDEDDFVSAFNWDYYVNGQLIAMPFGRSTPIMFANLDMLADEGLEVPTNWQELEQVTNALVVKDSQGQIERYGVAMPYDTWFFFMAAAQAGGQFVNAERTGLGIVDDGTGLAAYTFLQDLHNSGAMYFSPTTDAFTAARQVFLDRKAGLLITSTSQIATIDQLAEFNYTAAFVPAGRERVVPTGGNAVVVMEASPYKDEAWEFIEWLYTDEQGLPFFVVNTGYFPLTYSMAEADIVQEAWSRNPNYEIAFDQLEYASDRGHRVPQVGAIMNELFVLIQAVMYDNEDVAEQLEIMESSVADIMAED